MRFRTVHWRSWLVVGLLCGSAVGAARATWGPAYQDEASRTLSQKLFEQGAAASPAAPFHLSDLVVHPPDDAGAVWVTGRCRERSSDEGSAANGDEPFKFRASTPFQPISVAVDSDPVNLTVLDYLRQIAARVPQARLRVRYAWNERPAATIAIHAAAGALLIGVVWPWIIRRRNGPPIEMIDFSQLPRRSTTVTTKQVDITQVDSANERVLSVSCDSLSKEEAAIPELQTTSLDAPSRPLPENKTYRGDFYPTARGANSLPESAKHNVPSV